MKYRMFTMQSGAKVAINIDKVCFVHEILGKAGGCQVWMRETADGDMIKLEVAESFDIAIARLNIVAE